MIAEQINIFEISKPKYKIKKPIRLIEIFAGIGSQAKALKNIGANFEHYRAIDFDEFVIASYNAIHGTNFEPLDITKITAKDLGIVETDKYDYIMTYSFPCQDLSLAGKGAGMKKGSGTRSGLLWEVERLLKECKELPQILLMENVPQVINKKHFKDFREWQLFLEKLGYSNYFELLNAKDYSIPQNRNRCFMVSVLGDYYYQFPRKQKLKYRLKEFLEDEVDEKYFLTAKMLKSLTDTTNRNGFVRADKFRPINPLKKDIAYTITSNPGNRVIDNFIEVFDFDYIDGQPLLKIPEATKKGYALAQEGDGIDLSYLGSKTRRGRVQKGMIPTIKTNSDDIAVVVKGNYSPSGHSASRIVDINGLAPTVMENHGTVTAIAVKKEICNISKLKQFYKNIYIDEFNRAFIKVGNMFYRIRKVTPKECWRLMGFSDEDFEKAEKVNSNSQLYKQAGNSIVVQVLEAVFKEFF